LVFDEEIILKLSYISVLWLCEMNYIGASTGLGNPPFVNTVMKLCGPREKVIPNASQLQNEILCLLLVACFVNARCSRRKHYYFNTCIAKHLTEFQYKLIPYWERLFKTNCEWNVYESSLSVFICYMFSI
jgi:hypothetical protein